MRHIHFISFATVAALLGTFACGSDSSGGGGAGSPGGGGTSTGGAAGSGTGGATGGSAGAGTGGATGGAAGSGTGGATGGAAGAATGGTGGGATGACTNGADQAILSDPNSMVEQKVGDCGQQNLGAEPATKDCIKQQTGLSDGCVTCFDNTIQCAVQNCLIQCLGDSNAPQCIECRAQFCDGPFEQCSGLTVD